MLSCDPIISLNTVMELISTFQSENNLTLNYEIGPRRPGDIKAIFTDTSKIRSKLKWENKYTLADSLKHSWAWEKKLRGL